MNHLGNRDIKLDLVRIYVLIKDENLTLTALRLFLLDEMGHSRGRHARCAKKFDFSVAFFLQIYSLKQGPYINVLIVDNSYLH